MTLICAVLAGSPALAVDGEILINQAKANAGGITPGDGPGFPVSITRPGHYKLTGNLTVAAGSFGIQVLANDVTLDLNGFTLRATSRDVTLGIGTSGDRLRVMNGTITGFGGYGIRGSGAENCVVENMRVIDTSTGIGLSFGAHIRNSIVANHSGHGIECFKCLIEGNIVTGNGNAGIIDGNGGGGVVLGNVVVGNISYGIVAPDPPARPPSGYGNNIVVANNGGGPQVLGSTQVHPNVCEPACP